MGKLEAVMFELFQELSSLVEDDGNVMKFLVNYVPPKIADADGGINYVPDGEKALVLTNIGEVGYADCMRGHWPRLGISFSLRLRSPPPPLDT